jgi:hypothetical protein
MDRRASVFDVDGRVMSTSVQKKTAFRFPLVFCSSLEQGRLSKQGKAFASMIMRWIIPFGR